MHYFKTTTALFSTNRGLFPVPLLILLTLSIAFVSSLASEVLSDDIQPNTRPVYSAQQSQQQQQQHKAPTHHHNDRGGSRGDPVGSPQLSTNNAQSDGSPPKVSPSSTSQSGSTVSSSQQQAPLSHPSNRMLETRNSYAVLSQAMSQAVHHEFGMYHEKCYVLLLVLVFFSFFR